MPARRSPPVVFVVVVVLVVAALAVVVLDNSGARRPKKDADSPPAFAIQHPRLQPLDRALMLETAGRRDEAMVVLTDLLDREPDNADALFVLRRLLPPDLKAELGHRLAKCARPEEHFDDLVADAQADGDGAAVAALTAGMKKARPDDPRWGCEEIETLVRAKKYADATAKFREHHKAAKSDARSKLLHTFLVEMRMAGKSADAYAATPDADVRFALRTLGTRLEFAILGGTGNLSPTHPPKAELRALLAAHRIRAPDDHALRYFEGVLLQGDGELEKAEKEYAASLGTRPPPAAGVLAKPGDWAWDYEMSRMRRVECLCKLGQALRAYAECEPAEYTFQQIAFEFLKEKKPDALAELVAAHAKRFPSAPEVTYWTGEVRFLRGEYAKAAESFAAFEEAAPKASTERWRAPERRVRALLRAGDGEAAFQVSDGLPNDRLTMALRAAVWAGRGDADAVGLMLEAEAQRAGVVERFYADEDFAREIARPRYAALREKYPDPRRK
jgi:tetratricopeptide (TPR) repeat protein